MRSIGILGGMGPEATAAFYLRLIRRCQVDFGASNDEDFPAVVLFSLPVPDMVGANPAHNDLLRTLSQAGRAAENLGVTCLAIPCCTAHVLEAALRREFQVPLISIVEQVVATIEANGVRSVGVLGTRATVDSRLFHDPLAAIGVEVHEYADQGAVTLLIQKVMAGRAGQSERNALLAMTRQLEERGAEAVVLGCTELPLLLGDEQFGGAVIDPLTALADGVMSHLRSEPAAAVGRGTGATSRLVQGLLGPY
ncbi:MAG: amino acid racemase [Gemmataceae bacterium]